MNWHTWRAIGRWLLAVFVWVASLEVAALALMLTSVLIAQTWLRWAEATHLRMPVDIQLALLHLVAHVQ